MRLETVSGSDRELPSMTQISAGLLSVQCADTHGPTKCNIRKSVSTKLTTFLSVHTPTLTSVLKAVCASAD